MNKPLKYAALYGSLSGVVVIATILAGLFFADRLRFLASAWFGYLIMFVVLSFILVGVKRYRDLECGGIIRFLPAFSLGLAIAAVAGLAYVVVWEIYLAATHYRFMDDYAAGLLRSYKAAGMTGAELAQKVATVEAMRVAYANPLIRASMTFLEIFPVGFLVALISAALLRNPRFLPAPR